MENAEFYIRPIQPGDNEDLQKIIETVMPEYGAIGKGYAIVDPELKRMYETYSKTGYCYFVITQNKVVKGGAGIGPLKGAEDFICELQKMYFLKELRGQGFGQKLIDLCLEQARTMGYKKCYLETLDRMPEAQNLYRKNGFEALESPLGNTGHFKCDRYFSKEL